MITKEEILQQAESDFDDAIPYDRQLLYKAVEEYADIKAIEFCDWLDMHKYEFEMLSSEECYKLYEQSKINTNDTNNSD